MTAVSSALRQTGFVWIQSAFATPAAAFARSRELIEDCTVSNGRDALSVIGEFILPPFDGETTRDFQTLHFDFGLPLHPRCDQDVARYTALSIPRSAVAVTALTQLVPLEALLGQRRWPDQATLLGNLIAYGESHGAWDDEAGYSEGSVARVVEAAAGAPRLPSVKSTPGFLCGMEFDNLAAEVNFFNFLSLDVDAVQIEVPLRPGDLLVFDNLVLAHGRRGSRRPGELHQRVYGHRALPPGGSARTSRPFPRDVRGSTRAAAFGPFQPAWLIWSASSSASAISVAAADSEPNTAANLAKPSPSSATPSWSRA